MTWTPEQVETAKILARVMKEKGIKWEWREDDRYLWLTPTPPQAFRRGNIKGIKECYFEVERIPFPDFEQCLGLLKEWGRFFVSIDISLDHCEMEIHKNSWDDPEPIFVTAPDPITCVIKALTEVVKRLPPKDERRKGIEITIDEGRKYHAPGFPDVKWDNRRKP